MNEQPQQSLTEARHEPKARLPWGRPAVRSVSMDGAAAPVMLGCTGRIDCDALYGLGYECCAASEDECAGC